MTMTSPRGSGPVLKVTTTCYISNFQQNIMNYAKKLENINDTLDKNPVTKFL